MKVRAGGVLVGDMVITSGGPWLGYPPDPIPVHDRDFDERARVYGKRPVVRAIMSAELRREMTRIFSIRNWRALVLQGETVELFADQPDPEARDVLRRIAASARLDRGSVIERILTNLLEDPLHEVRAACLPAFLQTVGHAPPSQRLDVLRRLLESSELEDSPRAVALSKLGELPYERVRDIVVDHLRRPSIAVKDAAAMIAAKNRDRSVLPQIAALVTEPDPTFVLRAVHAVVEIGGEEVQGILLPLLRHADRRVVLAVVDALRSHGTLAAIEHLRSVGAGFFGDREEKQAARQAIEAIQRRCGTANAGAISLAGEDRGGAMSLNDAGRLSVSDE